MNDSAFHDGQRQMWNGVAIGRQTGFEEGSQAGYDAGHRDGWNAAMQTTNPEIEALKQERDALKRDRLDLQYAANAFAVISRTMQAVIADGTRDQQVEVIHRYNELVDQLIVHGSLRCPPHLDETVQAQAPDVADFVPQLAERLNSADDDYSP